MPLRIRGRSDVSTAAAGFTLIELMVTVAIIGVLAAIGIMSLSKYLTASKYSEAKNSVGAIARGAVGAYERETALAEILNGGATATAISHQLCGSAAAVPAAGYPNGVKYAPLQTEGSDFESGNTTTGWKCLKFSMSQPIYFRYSYYAASGYVGPAVGGLDPGANGFEAAAQGNVHNGSNLSTFARAGKIDASKNLQLQTQIYEDERKGCAMRAGARTPDAALLVVALALCALGRRRTRRS